VVAAVVPTTSELLTGAELVRLRLAGTVQFAGLAAEAGSVVTAQLRLIVPTKLLIGEATMLTVLPVVAPAAIESGPLFAKVNFDGLTLMTTDPVDPV
jgi:hypothetical protein